MDKNLLGGPGARAARDAPKLFSTTLLCGAHYLLVVDITFCDDMVALLVLRPYM